MNSLILLAVITVLVLFWFESLRIREQVIDQCKRICDESGIQLLDQTVSLHSVSLGFSRNTFFNVYRVYRFEISKDGTDRVTGFANLAGRRIEMIKLVDQSGATILYQSPARLLH